MSGDLKKEGVTKTAWQFPATAFHPKGRVAATNNSAVFWVLSAKVSKGVFFSVSFISRVLFAKVG